LFFCSSRYALAFQGRNLDLELFWKALTGSSIFQEVLMISFILAIGLGQAVAGAECPGGTCPATSSSVASSCASGNCSASSSGKLFRRGRSSGGSVAMVPATSPVATTEEKKTAETPTAVESVDSSSARRKALISFRR